MSPSEARKALVLFAHPALQKSRVNRQLLDLARTLPGVTVHDLYEEYPDLLIDVAREKQLLKDHDIVIFQHPFYWYSSPAMLKEWQDLVLEFGFAYGDGGNALEGKICLNAITTGGPAEAYQPGGYNKYKVRQLLVPFEQTANLCKMIYLPPFAIHRSLHVEGEALDRHLEEYRNTVRALQNPATDLGQYQTRDRINEGPM